MEDEIKCGTYETKPPPNEIKLTAPFEPGQTLTMKEENGEEFLNGDGETGKGSLFVKEEITEISRTVKQEPGEDSLTVKEERDDDSPIVEEQFLEGSVCYAMDLLNNASSSADIPENGLLFDNMPSDEEKVLKILHDADVNPEKTNEKAPLGVSVCKECDMMFPSEHRLRKHISVHHLNERNFTCWCGQKFGSRSGMNRHKQVVHRNHVLMCPYEGCDHPGYKCSKALTAHIRSVHTNVRPYLCDTCGKTFISGSQLKIHLRTHSDDVFQCKCGITFRRFIRLKKHQQLCLLI